MFKLKHEKMLRELLLLKFIQDWLLSLYSLSGNWASLKRHSHKNFMIFLEWFFYHFTILIFRMWLWFRTFLGELVFHLLDFSRLPHFIFSLKYFLIAIINVSSGWNNIYFWFSHLKENASNFQVLFSLYKMDYFVSLCLHI